MLWSTGEVSRGCGIRVWSHYAPGLRFLFHRKQRILMSGCLKFSLLHLSVSGILCQAVIIWHQISPPLSPSVNPLTPHPTAKVLFRKDAFIRTPFKEPTLNWLLYLNQNSTPLLSRALIRHGRNMPLTLVQVLRCLLIKWILDKNGHVSLCRE